MRTGKLPENVWKRSVLRQINQTKREEVTVGAGIGENCAVFSFGDKEMTYMSLDTECWPGQDAARLAMHRSVNALAASGAEPVAVDFSVLLPEGTEEEDVRAMAAEAGRECGLLGIQAAGFHIKVIGEVNRPAVAAAGIGRQAAGGGRISMAGIKPGQDIVASKWIGLEGTYLLAVNREKELLERYPARLLKEVKEYDRFLSVIPEAATAVKSGVCAMYSVAEGGIFAALWEMAAEAGVGLEVDWKKIPIKQETVEICEFFEISPYELASGGCLLMTAERGYDLVRELEKKGIAASVIGKTTDNNDKAVIHGEERRFLEMPKPDELYKVFGQNERSHEKICGNKRSRMEEV